MHSSSGQLNVSLNMHTGHLLTTYPQGRMETLIARESHNRAVRTFCEMVGLPFFSSLFSYNLPDLTTQISHENTPKRLTSHIDAFEDHRF